MKNLFSIIVAIAIVLICVFEIKAQTIVKDAQGNYTAVKRDTTAKNKPTGATFTDTDGKVYPVMVGPRGGLYYVKANGKKAYLKK